MHGAADWLDAYRQFWEESLDRLGEYLREVQAQAGTDDRSGGEA
jgi:hypothetical protein